MTKGIVLYDHMLVRGGAERVTLEMARLVPDTSLCYGYRLPGMFPDSEFVGVHCIDLGARSDLRLWRRIKVTRAFERRTKFLADYDWVIYSGTAAPVAVHNHPVSRNIYYCHTVPRFAYDMREYYLEQTPAIGRPVLNAVAAYTKKKYEAALARMDIVIANSNNVQRRLQEFLGVNAVVVNPPCDVDRYKWLGQDDYYLSTARLESYKRVDLIVEAFRQLPEKRLVIASGGSQLAALKERAKDCPNIRFVGWTSDDELAELVGRCVATIYVAKDEDFGMSPVESMAAGKPVVGVAEGGLLETVVKDQTGELVSSPPSVEDLVSAIHSLDVSRALNMRVACERRAQLYSREIFATKMRSFIAKE